MIRREKLTGYLAALLVAPLLLTAPANENDYAIAAETGYGENLTFKDELKGWQTEGDVTLNEAGVSGGSQSAKLAKGAKISQTITDVPQGSYTVGVWVKGTQHRNNDTKMTVKDTGGPESVALINTNLTADGKDWQYMGHRNVLVYNGQMTVEITAGSVDELAIDDLTITLDSEDENTIKNWDFEKGTESWQSSQAEPVAKEQADSGEQSIRLAAGGEVAQTVKVEPNTQYTLSMRAKVDTQDTFSQRNVENWRGVEGALVDRESTGNRVNLGVRNAEGQVLRQAPAGTTDYSLVTVTFKTGANDSEVTVYANTKYDDHYKNSVTLYVDGQTQLADDWQGNGAGYAYVDNFDLFTLTENNFVKGSDVSFLPAIEDNGGKYFANGVQQDCLRILSNHGVNSITTMIFVQAGNQQYDQNLKPLYWGWNDAEGSPMKRMMIPGYFDKAHSVALGKRATELGMSYLPSFHYSDAWMSGAKAYSPYEWINKDYEGKLKNTDMDHMRTIVYNYVYDFMSALKKENVHLAGVKHGNEQDGGILWPLGMGGKSAGHAKLIEASYEAMEAVLPGISGYVHTNNGYDTNNQTSFYKSLGGYGAKFDGAAHSLYGGRSSANIYKMTDNMLKNDDLKYLDYVNVETGFSFTRHKATYDQQTAVLTIPAYYQTSGNGQYNWLLDYMQAPLDMPNPYGQTRGFYYWETDWIPTPGAGSSVGGTADVGNRIMFNNGDTNIKEMGSQQPGKVGDMMDSMYAYLLRGTPKEKVAEMLTPLKDEGYAKHEVKLAEVSSIAFEDKELTLTEGQDIRLKPIIKPLDKVLKDNSIVYTSSDDSVAAVSQDGFIVAKGKGTATITGTVAGKTSATAKVTVKAPTISKAEDLIVTHDGKAIEDGMVVKGDVLKSLDFVAKLADSVSDQDVIYQLEDAEKAAFFGETWETEKGTMRQRTDNAKNVQLDLKEAGDTKVTVAAADGGAKMSFTVTSQKIAAKSVALNKTELQLSNGRKAKLTATVTPKDTTRYKVTWNSDNEQVATVDEEGNVYALTEGTAVIKAVSDDDPTVFAECRLTVLPVQVEGVALAKDALTIQVEKSKALQAVVTPEDAANKTIKWASADPSIVSVDEAGKITGHKIGGPVKITAETENGGYQAVCEVTVQKDAIPVEELVLEEKEYYFTSDKFAQPALEQGEPTKRLTAKILPEEATEDELAWSSSDSETVTVNEIGIMTAKKPGTATITAATKDGKFKKSAKIYVPTLSESFEKRDLGFNWAVGAGSVGGGSWGGSVKELGEKNQALLLEMANQSGGRSAMRKFDPKISNNQVEVHFDYYVGNTSGTNGAYFTLTDSKQNRYLSIQSKDNVEMQFNSGGQPQNNVALSGAKAVGTGFNKQKVWYEIKVSLDMVKKETTFTITNKEDRKITATHRIAFDKETEYAKDLNAIQFYASRNGALSAQWGIDNFNIYEKEVPASEIVTDKNSLRLIPVKDTLGVSTSIKGEVKPAAAQQAVLYESLAPEEFTVDDKGVVTAKQTYDSLGEIKAATGKIKVSAAADPSVFKEIPVTITNQLNAYELFGIYDEKDELVYTGGQAEIIKMEAEEKKQLFAKPTGGDGDTDIAKIQWTSEDEKVVKVGKESGKLTPAGVGETTINVKVTLYFDEMKETIEASLPVKVTGELPLELATLTEAIATAEAAKGFDDDYYTADSLAAYQAVIQQGKAVLATAQQEQWDGERQPEIDAAAQAVKNAPALLVKSDNVAIKSLTLKGLDHPVTINRKVQFTPEISPNYATEQIKWSSADEKIAKIDEVTGEITPLQAGEVKIYVTNQNGEVKAEKELTIRKDLTSWYEENGVVISGTAGGKAEYKVENPFINARTMNARSKQVWSTANQKKQGSIQVDLGAPAHVESMDLAFWSGMKYLVEGSLDGENWTTVYDQTGAFQGKTEEAFEIYLPENTVVRYLKLTTKETESGWTGITLIRAQGRIIGSVDKTELASKVSEAEGLKESDYSAESWAELSKVLTKAKAVNESPVTIQHEVDETVKALNQALEDLQPELVDKAALLEVIQSAEGYLQNTTGYTPASLANLAQAKGEAEMVYANEQATTGDVENAIAKVKAAITALIPVQEVLPEALKLNVSGIKTLKLGNTQALIATVLPETATNKTINWTIDNPKLVSIDENNVLKALKTGTTKVTATTHNGLKATFTIRITK